MKTLLHKGVTACRCAVTKTTQAIASAKDVLTCKRGEGYTDFALRVLIAVVLGALLLSGMYLIFSGTVLPTVTEKIKDLFNYSGT